MLKSFFQCVDQFVNVRVETVAESFTTHWAAIEIMIKSLFPGFFSPQRSSPSSLQRKSPGNKIEAPDL